MGLIGVVTPGYAPRKESTFDKVIAGINAASNLVNVGTNVADTFAKFKSVSNNARETELHNNEVKLKFLSAATPTTDDDPKGIEVDFDGKKTKWKPLAQSQGLKFDDYLSFAQKGYGKLLDEKGAQEAIKAGKDIKPAGGEFYFEYNPEKANLELSNNKQELANKQVQIANQLRTDFENQGEIKRAQETVEAFNKAKELEKSALTKSEDQFSLIYQFLRSQGSGIVSPLELETFNKTGSIPERMRAALGMSRFTEGTFIAPSRVPDIVDTIERNAKAAVESTKKTAEQFGKLAAQRGVNPSDVVREFSFEPRVKAQKSNIAPQPARPVGLTDAEKEELRILEQKYGGR